jgi:hypothetical protein
MYTETKFERNCFIETKPRVAHSWTLDKIEAKKAAIPNSKSSK